MRKLWKKAISLIVVFSLVISTGVISNGERVDASGNTFFDKYPITVYRVDGQVENAKNYTEDQLIVIFGRVTCSNCQSMASSGERAAKAGLSVKVLFLDVDSEEKDVKEYQEEHPSIVVAHSDYYNDMMWNVVRNETDEGYSIYFPLCAVLNKDRKIKMISTGYNVGELEETLYSQKEPNASIDYDNYENDSTIYNMNYKMKYGQSEAREMLNRVNDFRTGDNAWEWNSDDTAKIWHSGTQKLVYDYKLEKVAMQRAAEIALSYSHTRPNGGNTWSAYGDAGYSYSTAGENIAYGFGNEEAVFTAWQEEYDDYSGQGHRRNMLNDDFRSIGIAHVTFNGIEFWVQEFAAPSSGASYTDANDSNTNTNVKLIGNKIKYNRFEHKGDNEITIKLDEDRDLSSIYTLNTLKIENGASNIKQEFRDDWIIDDSSIAYVKNGTLIPKAVGTTSMRQKVTVCGRTFEDVVKVNVVSADQPVETTKAPETKAPQEETTGSKIIEEDPDDDYYDEDPTTAPSGDSHIYYYYSTSKNNNYGKTYTTTKRTKKVKLSVKVKNQKVKYKKLLKKKKVLKKAIKARFGGYKLYFYKVSGSSRLGVNRKGYIIVKKGTKKGKYKIKVNIWSVNSNASCNKNVTVKVRVK